MGFRQGAAEEEVVVPLPSARDAVPPATAFRSTWVVSSLESLRACGLWDRYTLLLKDHRHEVLSCVAGSWLPIAVARSHYLACDALALSREEMTELASGRGAEIRRKWYAPYLARAQGASGVWPLLMQVGPMWGMSAKGSAFALFKLGERRARAEYVGCELLNIRYFREAVRTVLVALLERASGRPSVQILPQPRDGEGHYLLQWR